MKDYPSNDMKAWGEMLLRYQDGRFQKDKFFCFFAMNYITRHRNSSSANWFIKDFNKGGPDSLEELQKRISDGDTSFVNRITYFNQHVRGSIPFWHQKRSELYTWINHHVQEGNGPPMFFITLSCAENQWPDVIALLQERMKIAGDDPSECYVGSPKLHKILNDYALVVQEYFQARVDLWLKSVGKVVFGIKHNWTRFEFAPGRGQIHAHLLAVVDDNSIYDLCYQDMKKEEGSKFRAKRLANWAQQKFGLTAMVPHDFEQQTKDEHPSTIRFSDSNPTNDGYRLMKECQYHDCSGFCMRPNQKTNK